MIIFIIFLSDAFYIHNDLDNSSYAIDTISHVFRPKLLIYTEAIEFLVLAISNLFPSFEGNRLIPSLGKSHFR